MCTDHWLSVQKHSGISTRCTLSLNIPPRRAVNNLRSRSTAFYDHPYGRTTYAVVYVLAVVKDLLNRLGFLELWNHPPWLITLDWSQQDWHTGKAAMLYKIDLFGFLIKERS